MYTGDLRGVFNEMNAGLRIGIRLKEKTIPQKTRKEVAGLVSARHKPCRDKEK